MKISKSTDLYLPKHFQTDQPIDQIMLICDVDGVIRNCANAHADPAVMAAIKELIKNKVDVTFISGSPVMQNLGLEIWRRGHTSLARGIGDYLVEEMNSGRLHIYGALGGQRLLTDDRIEKMTQYPLEIVFEVSQLLLLAFLLEVEKRGNEEQKKIAKILRQEAEGLELQNKKQPSEETPLEFKEIVLKIRDQLDPHFRLISYGALVETLTSHPEWGVTYSIPWLKEQIASGKWLISQLPEEERHIGTGVGECEGFNFNFLIISQISKSTTVKKHLTEMSSHYAKAFVITIGDTQIDIPMHEHAHLAYHVGKREIWDSYPMPQLMLVEDMEGKDSQHVKGTLHILELIQRNIGKPLSEWQIT